MKLDYSYQKYLISETFKNILNHKKALLAACPGAGKTRMTLEVISEFKRVFPDARIMIFAHGQNLLKEQWASVIQQNSSLKFQIINGSKELKQWDDTKIAITIPQSLFHAKDLKQIDLLIVDEAHHYCHADSTKKIIEELKPTYEIRLTGTPSIYIGKNWIISGITIQELLEKGVLCDPEIELIESKYDHTIDSYHANLNIKASAKFESDKTIQTLDGLKHRFDRKSWASIFESIGKTMIVCANQNHAKQVHNYFIKERIHSLISISDINSGSEELESFKADNKCNVFIVVNRGVLGFDYPGLNNLWDLSGTMNVNKLFQMLCRVIRTNQSNSGHKKRFLKISTPELSYLTYFIMSFVVALSDAEYYFTYKTKDTKRSDIPVPKEFLEHVEKANKDRNRKSDDRAPKKFPDLPKLMTFESIKNRRHGNIDTYAITNFRKVKQMLYRNREFDVNEILGLAKTCKTRYEFRMKYASKYKSLNNRGLMHLLDPILPSRFRKTTKDYTLKELKELASKYKSKHEFRCAHHGVFKWAKRNGMLDKLQFQRKYKTYTKWDLSMAMKKAAEFSSMKQFYIDAPGAWEFLSRKGKLNQIKKFYGHRKLTGESK